MNWHPVELAETHSFLSCSYYFAFPCLELSGSSHEVENVFGLWTVLVHIMTSILEVGRLEDSRS
jgi:hypothetical protein